MVTRWSLARAQKGGEVAASAIRRPRSSLGRSRLPETLSENACIHETRARRGRLLRSPVTGTGEPRFSEQLSRLAGHSLLYGAADVGPYVVNLALTPVFVFYLTTEDIGLISILLLLSVIAKLVFRMGVDAGFLRIHYEKEDDTTRRELQGTVVLFSLLLGSALFVGLSLGSVGLADRLARWLGVEALPSAHLADLVVLVFADTYLQGFLAVPLHLLRIEGRARRLAGFLAARNLLNTLLKLALLVGGFGVPGVLLSDLLATACLALAVLPELRRAVPVIRGDLLREVLAFGLPKAPHGVLIQMLNLADRWILVRFHGIALAGIYDKGYGLGAGVKFALSAFEPAWQPFVLASIGKPDARQTIARVVTYVWLVFVAVGLGLALFGRELLMLLTWTRPAFWPGAAVVPVIVLAYLLHGGFLLTSIGVGIEKRTRYYPVITATAAVSNVVANLALIPPYGMMGAAWATVISYAIMAVMGFRFSQRAYPIPFKYRRLAGIALAGVVTYAVSWLAPDHLLWGLAFKAGALLAFPSLLWLLRVWNWPELVAVRESLRRARSARAPARRMVGGQKAPRDSG